MEQLLRILQVCDAQHQQATQHGVCPLTCPLLPPSMHHLYFVTPTVSSMAIDHHMEAYSLSPKDKD